MAWCAPGALKPVESGAAAQSDGTPCLVCGQPLVPSDFSWKLSDVVAPGSKVTVRARLAKVLKDPLSDQESRSLCDQCHGRLELIETSTESFRKDFLKNNLPRVMVAMDKDRARLESDKNGRKVGGNQGGPSSQRSDDNSICSNSAEDDFSDGDGNDENTMSLDMEVDHSGNGENDDDTQLKENIACLIDDIDNLTKASDNDPNNPNPAKRAQSKEKPHIFHGEENEYSEDIHIKKEVVVKEEPDYENISDHQNAEMSQEYGLYGTPEQYRSEYQNVLEGVAQSYYGSDYSPNNHSANMRGSGVRWISMEKPLSDQPKDRGRGGGANVPKTAKDHGGGAGSGGGGRGGAIGTRSGGRPNPDLLKPGAGIKNMSLKERRKCDYCGQVLLSRAKFDLHILTHESFHEDTRLYECNCCTKTYTDAVEFSRHYKTEHNKERLTCKLCKMVFTRFQSLYEHEARHKLDDVEAALLSRRTEIDQELDSYTTSAQNGKIKYTCNSCQMTFSRYKFMYFHLLNHLAEKGVKGVFECGTCRERFDTEEQWEIHNENEHFETRHVCQKCGTSFNRFDYLIDHNRTQHPTPITELEVNSPEWFKEKNKMGRLRRREQISFLKQHEARKRKRKNVASAEEAEEPVSKRPAASSTQSAGSEDMTLLGDGDDSQSTSENGSQPRKIYPRDEREGSLEERHLGEGTSSSSSSSTTITSQAKTQSDSHQGQDSKSINISERHDIDSDTLKHDKSSVAGGGEKSSAKQVHDSDPNLLLTDEIKREKSIVTRRGNDQGNDPDYTTAYLDDSYSDFKCSSNEHSESECDFSAHSSTASDESDCEITMRHRVNRSRRRTRRSGQPHRTSARLLNETRNSQPSNVKERREYLTNSVITTVAKYCPVCSKLFTGDRRYAKHVKQDHERLGVDGPYVCALCQKGPYTRSTWEEHMRGTHSIDPNVPRTLNIMKCFVCNYVFFEEDRMEDHLLGHLSPEGDFMCDTCNATFELPVELVSHHRKEHVRPHRRQQRIHCMYCTRVYSCILDIEKHFLSHVKDVCYPHRCSCGMIFPGQRVLKEHQTETGHPDLPRVVVDETEEESVTEEESDTAEQSPNEETEPGAKTGDSDGDKQPDSADGTVGPNGKKRRKRGRNKRKLMPTLICPVCNKIFAQRMRLAMHVQEHTAKKSGEEGYECSTCKATLGTLLEWRVHVRDHLLKERHPCPVCGMTFTRRNEMFIHKRRAHPRHRRAIWRSNEPAMPETSEIYNRQKTFKCDICFTISFSEESHQCHMDEHEANNYKCRACPLYLNTAEALSEHMTKEHRSVTYYRCSTCGKTFDRLYELNVHKDRHRRTRVVPIKTSDGKLYKCTCLRVFQTHSEHAAHRALAHNRSAKGLICHTCGKLFKSTHDLHIHLDYDHQSDGPFPFTCVACDKAFLYHASLVLHVRKLHTPKDTSGNLCNHCGKTLATIYRLREHLMIHTGEKPLTCEICGKTFRHRSSWDYHMTAHKGGFKHECVVCNKRFFRAVDLKRHSKVHS